MPIQVLVIVKVLMYPIMRYLKRRVLYCTSANKGNYNSNNIDSQLKLEKLRDAIVDISAPHNSFDYATEVVIR